MKKHTIKEKSIRRIKKNLGSPFFFIGIIGFILIILGICIYPVKCLSPVYDFCESMGTGLLASTAVALLLAIYDKNKQKTFYYRKMREQLEYFILLDDLDDNYDVFMNVHGATEIVKEITASIKDIEYASVLVLDREEFEALEKIRVSLLELLSADIRCIGNNEYIYKDLLNCNFSQDNIKAKQDIERIIRDKYNLDGDYAFEIAISILIIVRAIENIKCAIKSLNLDKFRDY